MTRYVTLDTGIIGLLCSAPGLPNVAACEAWLAGLDENRVIVVIPDVTVYEIRRELIRIDAKAKLARLGRLRDALGSCPVPPEAWLKAAEFWAIVRQAGRPTADPHALDGDSILAGVAATIGGPDDSVTIATTNAVHLSRSPGINARSWEAIA